MTTLPTIDSKDLLGVTGGRMLPPDPATGPLPVPPQSSGLGPKGPQTTGPTKGNHPSSAAL